MDRGDKKETMTDDKKYHLDFSTWQRKAMAFSTRAHRHLWGKNNEDPLAFIFCQGLGNEFAKSLYLGWNKFGQERPFQNWGLSGQGKFTLPAGIVFPHIVNKDLRAVFIISMEDPRSIFLVPGSEPGPVVLENFETKGAKKEFKTRDIIQGLVLFQDNPGCRVSIPLTLNP